MPNRQWSAQFEGKKGPLEVLVKFSNGYENDGDFEYLRPTVVLEKFSCPKSFAQLSSAKAQDFDRL